MRMSKSTQIATLGDESILDLPKVGFLSSRKVPPAAVMKCYDWATEMRDQGVCWLSRLSPSPWRVSMYERPPSAIATFSNIQRVLCSRP